MGRAPAWHTSSGRPLQGEQGLLHDFGRSSRKGAMASKGDQHKHRSHGGLGRHHNEKRGMGTYWLEELCATREGGRCSSSVDEALDRRPLDVGSEE